jgi:hypothetical protein
VWSRLDPILPVVLVDAARGWSIEPWHGLLFVIALSAWAVDRDAREGGVIGGS